ncbi:MAG: hypothetical protein HOJ95_05955 [Nitrospinaceae bacterium]|jgi:hypothetical protein|nr:hypothetical protein [Nitrospinaceae bacterium]MBT3821015.1 hypothetical protein [Nitrospinaceae bacterium]MBT4093042.1 hypothetical protein [Nitrospinaceae bacterium]MBT5369499.1 hypothetical protein [Nitrospinaceae bacterium]MBT5946539.1 hypothetical protein [Nitrospinaceae bacterium]
MAFFARPSLAGQRGAWQSDRVLILVASHTDEPASPSKFLSIPYPKIRNIRK